MVREHPTLSSGYSQTSGVPPDNPQEQVLRGPAGEEAAGGQQAREFFSQEFPSP